MLTVLQTQLITVQQFPIQVRLIQMLMELGMHVYRVVLLASDSVPGNNEVFGILECEDLWDAESESPGEWVVYPNPGQGSILLHMQEAAGPGSTVQLLGLDGRILRSFPLAEGERMQVLELGSLEAGIYLLRDERGVRTVSLLITH